MTVLLTLGGVVFSGFEVPDVIATGGDQALVIHKLPGGSRIIDAMGADHRDLSWSGRFRGGNAEARARLLDGYRIGGKAFLLTWSTFRYRVIVRSFEAQYQQPFEIPYSISCTVLSDESAPVLTGIRGVDELIGSDIGRALGLTDSAGVASVASAVSAVQQSIAVAGTLQNAGTSTIASVAGSVLAAQQVTAAAFTVVDATLGSTTPVVAGGSPAAMATSLTSQATAFGQLDSLFQISGTLARMGKNLAA